MFLKKANFFENLTLIALESEAEPMKHQVFAGKTTVSAPNFYQIRLTNTRNFDIAMHAGFTRSIFRIEPVSKNTRFCRLKCPRRRF